MSTVDPIFGNLFRSNTLGFESDDIGLSLIPGNASLAWDVAIGNDSHDTFQESTFPQSESLDDMDFLADTLPSSDVSNTINNALASETTNPFAPFNEIEVLAQTTDDQNDTNPYRVLSSPVSTEVDPSSVFDNGLVVSVVPPAVTVLTQDAPPHSPAPRNVGEQWALQSAHNVIDQMENNSPSISLSNQLAGETLSFPEEHLSTFTQALSLRP